MQPHQERVVAERKARSDELARLGDFIDKSPLWNKVNEVEQTLLKNQRTVMGQLVSILDQRIALWKEPV